MSDRLQILVVEDNPADQALLGELLEEAGATGLSLEPVDTLAAAISRLSVKKFDAVLLDLSLPDGEGLACVEGISRVAPSVAIVVLSGSRERELPMAAVSAGAQDFLPKGQFDGQLLSRSLRYAVERKRAEESGRKLTREQLLRTEAEASGKRWRLLAEASRLVTERAPISVLPSVVEKIAATLGDFAVIELSGQAGFPGVLRVGAYRSSPTGPATSFREETAVWGDSPGERVFEEGRATALAGAGLQAPWAAFGPPALSRLFSSPISAHGRVMGALTVGLTSGTGFSDQDLPCVDEICHQLGLSLENARLSQARDEILSVVSHDLRNPLSVVLVASTLLKDGDPRRNGYVEKIERATGQMKRLIEDLLDVARLDSGKLAVATAPVPAEALVVEAAEAARPAAEAKRLTLHVEPPSPAVRVEADRDRILQVLGNLLGNALKFTPEGGRVSVGASAVERDGSVRFFVEDSGPGIPRGEEARIFDRFWQGRREDRRGVGLGLSIARGLVEAHGGKLWVDSRPGEGARLCFTLPTLLQTAAFSSGETRSVD